MHRLKEYSERATAMVVLMQIILILKTNHTNVGGEDITNPYGEMACMIQVLADTASNDHSDALPILSHCSTTHSLTHNSDSTDSVDFLKAVSFLSLDVITALPIECAWEGHL